VMRMPTLLNVEAPGPRKQHADVVESAARQAPIRTISSPSRAVPTCEVGRKCGDVIWSCRFTMELDLFENCAGNFMSDINECASQTLAVEPVLGPATRPRGMRRERVGRAAGFRG